MKRIYDLVVAGGGPAGSTVATLVKRYSPSLRVLLLEKAHFPRHHVGESLLPGASPILKEMGVYEQVERYGFPEKLGAVYVWGQNRDPWGFEFDDLVAPFFAQGKILPQVYTKGWQVRRAEYDHLLLQNAIESDVEVLQGAHVRRPIIDEKSGRVTGVQYRDSQGTHEVGSTYFVDCTGQDALLSRHFGLRDFDPRMDNYALYGYWQGAKWEKSYVGFPQLTRIFITTSPRGWLWYIPISDQIFSIGFVTRRDTLKQARDNPETLYLQELEDSPEISKLLTKAQLIRYSPGQTRDVLAVRDWAYTSRQMVGDGWALVGDAAGFVDPILSSGVMLAHELGQKAAYTINSSFNASSNVEIKRYWEFYQETYQTYLQAYREMAAYWYSNNFSMESWWWQARRMLEQDSHIADLDNREAFNRLAAGYANRTESLSLFGSYPLHEALQLVDGLFGSTDNNPEVSEKGVQRFPHLTNTTNLTEGMYFFQGLIRKTKRVVNSKNGKHLDLHPAEEVLIKMMDGSTSLAEIDQVANRIRELGSKKRLPVRNGSELVVQLDRIGAIVSPSLPSK